jgi:hydrogenase maturation protease
VSATNILVGGIGNAWLKDDGFGGEVAKRLNEQELPAGVAVFDFGTGGLDLAYEMMRGYDGLVLVDISAQGGQPGTLYVMEPDEESVTTGIEDGVLIDPHGMDPQTVLRFVKTISGWPGHVVVIACEPAQMEEMGFGLSDDVAGAVDRAVTLVLDTIADMKVSASRQS